MLAFGELTESECVCVRVHVRVLRQAISYLPSLNHCVLTSAESGSCNDFSIVDALILLTQPQYIVWFSRHPTSHVRDFSQLILPSIFHQN